MVVDGKVINLVNFWKHDDINAGDDLMMYVEDRPSVEYVLSHHPKSMKKQVQALGVCSSVDMSLCANDETYFCISVCVPLCANDENYFCISVCMPLCANGETYFCIYTGLP